ncbi:MAG: PD-(D/E)XK nuclease family protein, partial [Hyphomonadaceae bacterium]
ADRVDLLPDGAAMIVDYKSGAPPSDNEVKAGLAPQLLLEAAMLAAGAFPEIPRSTAKELIYWHFGGPKPAAREVSLDLPVMDAANAALKELRELIARYADEKQPFLSKPRAQFVKPYDDYDLLARRKEWMDAGDEQ